MIKHSGSRNMLDAPNRIAIVVGLLALLPGCLWNVPNDRIVDIVSDIALQPDRSCEDVAVTFGIIGAPVVNDPAEVGIDYVETYLTTSRGERIRAWHIPAEDPKGVVLLSSGTVADMSCYLLIAVDLWIDGWSLVMYDYEGYGLSSGEEATMSSLPADGDAALDWALEVGGFDRVVVHGISIGSIPAVALAAQRPDDVAAVVLDGTIDLGTEAPGFDFILGGRSQELLAEFDDALKIAKQLPFVTAPIFAIQYGRDEFQTSYHLPELLATSPATSVILEYPNSPHARAPYWHYDSYSETLHAFLDDIAVELAAAPADDANEPSAQPEVAP